MKYSYFMTYFVSIISSHLDLNAPHLSPGLQFAHPYVILVMHRLFFHAENCKRGKIQIHKK